MQNWEVAKKRISEMNKDEFIDFIRSADRSAIHHFADLCDTEMRCREKECFKSGIKCIDCIIDLLEKEYQPPKQEKWIVHRTLRTNGMETYVSIIGSENGFKKKWLGDYKEFSLYGYLYKPMARKFDKEEAILIRDLLNQDRVGKQYLWVISKVDE